MAANHGRSDHGTRRERRYLDRCLRALALPAVAVVALLASPALASALPSNLEVEALPSVGLSSSPEIAPYSKEPSETRPYAVCPPPTTTRMSCMAVGVPTPEKLASLGLSSPTFEGSGEGGGWSAAQVGGAYRLLGSEGGKGMKVAITVAHDDPSAEEDLKKYRERYGLGECTKANGCFEKVNGKGEAANYPTPDEEWAQEASLDLDMVSATCPECHILLVEATSEFSTYQYPAVEEAAKLGANVISNSWAGVEYSGETSEDHYFEHPGVPVLFASGDSGYFVQYPASSAAVISVGGTSLKTAKNTRGWSETAWGGAGSGCSKYESKPTWQTDSGCAKRTVADVSAVADPNTPVSVYDSYGHEKAPWLLFGGTSVATPILAGYEAKATSTFKEKGAKAFYEAGKNFEDYDVLTGTNENILGCPTSTRYLCESTVGYDGPTGWGTPGAPLPEPPAVTGAPTKINGSNATLTGTLNPTGKATTYYFEYDTKAYTAGEAAHGTKTVEVSAGSGKENVEATQKITGLELETTYHYRIAAKNTGGTTYGEDREVVPGSWFVESSPGVGEGSLSDVSCTAVSACTAVGHNESKLLVERWNGSAWSQQTPVTPTGASSSSFSGISCLSATECIAVGDYKNSGGSFVTLAERWNGTGWAIQTTPNPAEAANSFLSDVSCTSASSCKAVGEYKKTTGDYIPFAESWNGTEWTVQSTPAPKGATEGYLLTAVSCVSSTACTSVGEPSFGSGSEAIFADRWNGTEWQIQEIETAVSRPGLSAISCASTSDCIAVGAYNGTNPLAEHWNGSKWAQQSITGHEGSLEGVSCTATSACTAAGHSGNDSNFAEYWNGVEWRAQTVPKKFGYTYLRGVSCTVPAAKTCMAVGFSGGFPGESTSEPLIVGKRLQPSVTTEAATGITQTEATLKGSVNPDALETKYYFEYGLTTAYGTKTSEVNIGSGATKLTESKLIVGLTSSTTYHFRVVATNSAGITEGKDQSFTTAAPPAWRVSSTPNPAGASLSSLGGPSSGSSPVSCTSSTACSAVGYYKNSAGTEVTLAEHWNGVEWSIQSTPNPGGSTASYLSGVSCTSASACTAVGYYQFSPGTNYPFAERWNGSEWKVQEAPNPSGSTFTQLRDVSCSSSTACTAVGYYEPSAGGRLTLVEQWNGSSWSIQSSPNPSGAFASFLDGVSCSSSTACTAVGYYLSGSHYVTLAEQWNGTSWSIQSTPNPSGGTEDFLGGVSCSSSTTCAAVGSYKNSVGTEVTLAEQWNGTEWSVKSTPNPSGGTANFLGDVSCVSSGECAAVGSYKNSGGTEVTLAERWNGSSWSIQSTPNPSGAKASVLGGVSCSTSTTCASVGSYKNSAGTEVTLAELYS